MTNTIAPPIGIMPEWLHLEQRKQALEEAINRYLNSTELPKVEWFEELGRIKTRLQQMKDEGKYRG